MKRTINVGILGDFDPGKASHPATDAAIRHAARYLSIEAGITWLPTPSLLTVEGRKKLAQFDCLWASPGSPYKSREGVIKAIQFAREMDYPFIGTCGGFQHTLLEYAMNVSGLADAGHAEEDPDTATPLLILAACPVDGRPQGAPRLWGGIKINISPDSLAFSIYRSPTIKEMFTCSYELNPAYRDTLEKNGLRVSGISEDGGTRIVELPEHRFFIATGFVPQLSSEEDRPHPLIIACLKAAAE